jgi:uncharacterized membrane protein YphA (DoxX/SURF4 family)
VLAALLGHNEAKGFTMQPEEAPANAAHSGIEITHPTPSFSWEASEFVQHDKPASWYIGLWAGVVILCAILGLLQQWVSIVVVVVMTIAILVYSRKEPRTLEYALDDKGISINGRLSPYSHFRSFNVQEEVGWKEIDLEPTQRFSPRLTLIADDENLEQIADILAHHLPEVNRTPDIIERLSRYLKF